MLVSILPLAGLGTLLGFLLGVASRVLYVERSDLAQEIEALLPGTQCGQCGNPSCGAAAEAAAAGELPPAFCPPGGRAVAEAVAAKLGLSLDLASLVDEQPRLAEINEDICIGCTRCYKVCPTDAIAGAAKQMHVVFADACTACGKCEEVCPTECIRLVVVTETLQSWAWNQPSL